MLRALTLIASLGLGRAYDRKVSQEEAICLLDGKDVCIYGDSNNRFFTFSFNEFLCTDDGFDSYDKWGEAGPPTSNTLPEPKRQNVWTSGIGRSSNPTHHQDIYMDFKKGCTSGFKGTTRFNFITSTWFDDGSIGKKNDCDIVIANSGWWDLKPWDDDKQARGYGSCGTDYDDSCTKQYTSDLKKIIGLMDDAGVGVWRDCSCCGDTPDEPDTVEAVQELNEVAADVFKGTGFPVVKVFDLYTDVDDGTVDGTHATPAFYEEWTDMILQAIEDQEQTGCLGGKPKPPKPDEDDEDEKKSCGKSKKDGKWYYKKDKSKDCKWAKEKDKCDKKDKDGNKAKDVCCKSCKSGGGGKDDDKDDKKCKKDDKKWYTGKKSKKRDCKWVKKKAKKSSKKKKDACGKRDDDGVKARDACCKACK